MSRDLRIQYTPSFNAANLPKPSLSMQGSEATSIDSCLSQTMSSLRFPRKHATASPRALQLFRDPHHEISPSPPHALRSHFRDPIPPRRVLQPFITRQRQSHEPRVPGARFPALHECGLHIVRCGVVFERVVGAVLGGFRGHVVSAHDVRAWESEVAEEVFADAEGDRDEVVVEVWGSGIPMA